MKAAFCVSAFLVGWPLAAGAQTPFSTVYVFGDSLSDDGNIPDIILSQDPDFPLIFPVSPPYFDAHFSNGPTYAELLPGLLGLTADPDQNLAVGGAETDDENVGDDLLPPSVELPGISEQIDAFEDGGGSFSSSSLVILFGGANDYFGVLDENPSLTDAEISGFVAETVGNIEEDIRRLAGLGAQTLIIPNVPNLGLTPAYSGSGQEEDAAALAAEHAALLNATLGGLGDELGVQIIVVDFATGFGLLLENPALFGFTNVTEACVTSSTSLPAYVTPGTVCSPEEQATWLFWDSVHPTATAHEILAAFAADTVVAPMTVPSQAELALVVGDDFLRRMAGGAGGDSFGGTAILPTHAFQDRPYELFLSAGHANGSRDFDGASGFDYDMTTIAGGLNFAATETLSAGVVAAYDTGQAGTDEFGGSADVTAYRLGAHAAYDGGRFFGSAGLAYSLDDYDLARQTLVGVLSTEAETEGDTFGGFLAAGYRFNVGRLLVGPISGLRYSHTTIDGYSESGAPGLDMIVEEQSVDTLIASGGVALAAEFPLGSATVSPFVELTLEGDLLDGDRTLTTALVTVPDVPRDLIFAAEGGAFGRLAGGVAIDIGPTVSALIEGETTFGLDGGDDVSVLGRISARF